MTERQMHYRNLHHAPRERGEADFGFSPSLPSNLLPLVRPTKTQPAGEPETEGPWGQPPTHTLQRGARV